MKHQHRWIPVPSSATVAYLGCLGLPFPRSVVLASQAAASFFHCSTSCLHLLEEPRGLHEGSHPSLVLPKQKYPPPVPLPMGEAAMPCMVPAACPSNKHTL